MSSQIHLNVPTRLPEELYLDKAIDYLLCRLRCRSKNNTDKPRTATVSTAPVFARNPTDLRPSDVPGGAVGGSLYG